MRRHVSGPKKLPRQLVGRLSTVGLGTANNPQCWHARRACYNHNTTRHTAAKSRGRNLTARQGASGSLPEQPASKTLGPSGHPPRGVRTPSHNDPDSKISLKDTNLKVRAVDSATLAVAWYQAEAAAARITIRGTSATRSVLYVAHRWQFNQKERQRVKMHEYDVSNPTTFAPASF